MKKIFLLFVTVLFCTFSKAQNPEGIKGYILSMYNIISVTNDSSEFVASASKSSTVIYNESNYNQFEISTSFYDVENSAWIDAKLNLHLGELMNQSKDSDLVNYMYEAISSDGQTCILFFGVDQVGMIESFVIILNLDGKYYYTELLKTT